MSIGINTVLKGNFEELCVEHMALDDSEMVSAGVLGEYISVCELGMMHNHDRLTIEELVLMRCEYLNRVVLWSAVKVFRYTELQSVCPNYVFEVAIDIDRHKELVDNEINYIKERYPRLEGYDCTSFCRDDEDVVRVLYHNLLCYRVLLQKLNEVLSCPNENMLKQLYAEADKQMTARYGLSEMVDIEVKRKELGTRGGKPSIDEVNKWKDEMYGELERKDLGDLKDVLEILYIDDGRDVEIGRYILKKMNSYKFDNKEDRCINKEDLLKCIMAAGYRQKKYQSLMKREVALPLKVSTPQELKGVTELLNAIPSDNISPKMTHEMILEMWQRFLESSLHGRLAKKSGKGYKGLNLRMVSLLFGRSLYYNVYGSITPADMGKMLSKVCGGDAEYFSNYIRDGKTMNRESIDVKETVDEIFNEVLLKR